MTQKVVVESPIVSRGIHSLLVVACMDLGCFLVADNHPALVENVLFSSNGDELWDFISLVRDGAVRLLAVVGVRVACVLLHGDAWWDLLIELGLVKDGQGRRLTDGAIPFFVDAVVAGGSMRTFIQVHRLIVVILSLLRVANRGLLASQLAHLELMDILLLFLLGLARVNHLPTAEYLTTLHLLRLHSKIKKTEVYHTPFFDWVERKLIWFDST